MNNLIESIVAVLATSSITFFFTKRKYKTEVTAAEIKNLMDIIDAHREHVADLKLRVSELSDEVRYLRKTSSSERL